MINHLRFSLFILIIICAILSIGAEGCPWTSRDPDITTGGSGEPKPTSTKILSTGGSVAPDSKPADNNTNNNSK